MKAILALLLAYILISSGLIALGVGVGSLLHWMLPAVDLGTGILIAVVVTGLSIHYILRLLRFSELFELPRYDHDDDTLPVLVYPPAPPRSRRKRKRNEP